MADVSEILRTIGDRFQPNQALHRDYQDAISGINAHPEAMKELGDPAHRGHRPGSLSHNLFKQTLDNSQAQRTLIPYMRMYSELRQSGIGHNEAVDQVIASADPKEAELVAAAFDQSYVANRQGFNDA